MNRSMYIKNLILFCLFVAIAFASPFVFADTEPATPSTPLASQLTITGGTTPLYSRSGDNSQVTTQLQRGSVIQLPTEVASQVLASGNPNVSLQTIINAWSIVAENNPNLRPRNGGNLYPVKVKKASDLNFNLNSRSAVGFIDLESLENNFTHNFNTLNSSPVIAPIASVEETLPATAGAFYDDSSYGGVTVVESESTGDETTSADDHNTTVVTNVPVPHLHPQIRIEGRVTRAPTPAPTTVMNPHANPRCENIRGRVASALGEGINSRRVACYLDLFHKETGCRPNLSQRAGNAGNANAGYGLCSLEASPAIRRQNRRGPECVNISTVEQQTRCCAAIMARHGGAYFGPVKIGVVDRCD